MHMNKKKRETIVKQLNSKPEQILSSFSNKHPQLFIKHIYWLKINAYWCAITHKKFNYKCKVKNK